MLSPKALRSQIRSARNSYGSLPKSTLRSLAALLTEHNLSLVRGCAAPGWSLVIPST